VSQARSGWAVPGGSGVVGAAGFTRVHNVVAAHNQGGCLVWADVGWVVWCQLIMTYRKQYTAAADIPR
jgi:hypothetical protein